MGKAIQDLKNEHAAILRVLAITDRALAPGAADTQALLRFGTELVRFLRVFADTCHHGKEEGFLFTRLEQKGMAVEGGPIGVMLEEHRVGREYIASMSRALETASLDSFSASASAYRDLLLGHIAKENNVLFLMADRVLDDAEQDALFESFEEHEQKIIGQGVHEELHAMIDRWEAEFSA